jgi:acetate kinase
MKPANALILTINGGSSSIKFALYQVEEPLKRGLYGKVDRIGLSGTNLTFHEPTKKQPESCKLAAGDHKSVANSLIDWLEKQIDFKSVKGVGHRVVHGMKHTEPEVVTQKLLDELRRISPNDPDHLPREIELIETFRERHRKLPQVACFDTAFHQTMPRVAKLLPIPRRFDAKGIQRYGFHGLSYAYLMEELTRLGDPAATKGRVVLAHLGNGASLAAVRDGKSIDTSMGFTPTAGLVMSTRSGDLDPGLAPYLARTEQMTTSQFYKMVNHESGLLGVSETSSDMRDLLDHEKKDVRAAEAVSLFCYQAKKWIGSFAAALGGLETIVFAGGIGENAPLGRAVHGEHDAGGNVESPSRSRRPWPGHGVGRRRLRKSFGRVCEGRHQCGQFGRAASRRGGKVICEILERIAGGDRIQDRRAQADSLKIKRLL